MKRACARLVVLLTALVAGCSWWGGEKAVVEARLNELADVVNSSAGEGGLAASARAGRIGTFFTDDVVVELGRGAGPIIGRQSLIAMAGRLEPRTSAFSLKLIDVHTRVASDARTAEVTLTVEIARHSAITGQPSLDAREFTLSMQKLDGVWMIARANAVETLK